MKDKPSKPAPALVKVRILHDTKVNSNQPVSAGQTVEVSPAEAAALITMHKAEPVT